MKIQIYKLRCEGILLCSVHGAFFMHFVYFKPCCCVAKRDGWEPHSAVFYFTVDTTCCKRPMFSPNMLAAVHALRWRHCCCAHIVGLSLHGNEFQHITYMWGAVDHDNAPRPKQGGGCVGEEGRGFFSVWKCYQHYVVAHQPLPALGILGCIRNICAHIHSAPFTARHFCELCNTGYPSTS